jgi:hypothetical protein
VTTPLDRHGLCRKGVTISIIGHGDTFEATASYTGGTTDAGTPTATGVSTYAPTAILFAMCELERVVRKEMKRGQ